METTISTFILRILAVAGIWAFIWYYVEPRTRALRILRAALLTLSLLGVLTAMKIVSG